MANMIWGTEDTVQEKGTRSSVAMLSTGGYVVTWRDNQGETAAGKAAFQVYDAFGGRVGGVQFADPDGTTTQQYAQAQAFGSDGRFAMTWFEQNGPIGTIYTQIYDQNGKVGGRTTFISGADVLQWSVATTSNEDGWALAYVEANALKIALSNSDGILSSIVPLGTTSSKNPHLTYLGNATYLVAYEDSNVDHFRMISSSGQIGAGATFADLADADVVALLGPDGKPSGAFVIVSDSGTSVVAQHFTANGTLDATTTLVAAKDQGELNVAATALKDGGYAAVYIERSTNPDESEDRGDVFVRAFHGGSPAGDPIRVNARASIDGRSAQYNVDIAEMADGRLSVTWEDGSTLHGQVSTVIVDTRTAAVTVVGTSRNDAYVGTEFNDRLTGAGGNDTLIGGAGADHLDGGSGSDTVSYATASVGVRVDLAGGAQTGDAAGDVLVGIESVVGSTFNDVLIGDGADNRLDGGVGDDLLVGAAGADILIGGSGSDTVSYSASMAGVTVDLGAAGSGGDAAGDTYAGIENAIGSNGNDTLIGTSGANILSGGAGNDTYAIQDSADVVSEAANGGIDTVTASVSATLSANVENLVGTGSGALALTGNDLDNSIAGTSADNVVNGGAGADTMMGGAGNDIYVVDNLGDVVNDTAGTDTVILSGSGSLARLTGIEIVRIAATGAATVDGNDAANTLNGNDAANTLNGMAGNDLLLGLGGADRILGGTGNDTLSGSAGNDVLTGGAGRDVFVFDSGLGRTNAANKRINLDRVTDFSVRDDSIHLAKDVFTKLGRKGVLSQGAFHAGAEAHDGNDRIIYNKQTGALFYDSDGTGSHSAIQFATLSKNLKLTNKDFFVV